MSWTSKDKWVKLSKIYYRAQFENMVISPFLNPSYLIRRGLYLGISKYSGFLKGSILDFGCGRKPYTSLFSNCNSYTGLDIKLNEDSEKNVFADIYYDGITFPIPSSSFDNVFSSDTFELISNPDVILGEIHRVLKDDGYFLLTVPFVWEEHWLPFDYSRYSSSGIKTLLEKNNFSVLSVDKSTSYFITTLQTFIFFIYQKVFPKNKYLKLIFTTLFLSPLNLIGLLTDKVFPNRGRDAFYHNNIVLARKVL